MNNGRGFTLRLFVCLLVTTLSCARAVSRAGAQRQDARTGGATVFLVEAPATGEVFTRNLSFEGVNFYVYRKTQGRWLKRQEFYTYRCAD